jgi:16S rRNA (adenine(1408)-N(1))-methyltransferase
VRSTAAQYPDELVIGVDAVAENLRAQARKLAAKPARGGLPNALLGRLALADAPGALKDLADRLTVLLPWGALLSAVARPEAGDLAALRAICREGAAIRFVFGYGPEADGTRVKELALPAIDDDAGLAALSARYRDAGFTVRARGVSVAEIRTLPTTWAKRLAFSGRQRPFVEVSGRAV